MLAALHSQHAISSAFLVENGLRAIAKLACDNEVNIIKLMKHGACEGRCIPGFVGLWVRRLLAEEGVGV